MDAGQLLAPEDPSPLGRSRADVLDMLRAADGPLGVREVAQRMGLHQNTARFHLEALAEAVVCSLHLGMLQGALAKMRAPVTADQMEAFAEPSLCVARLAAHAD